MASATSIGTDTERHDHLFDLPAFPPPPACLDPLPRIAVIMPLYNACTPSAVILHTALSSILSQTYTAFSFFVVDDASTDSSAELLRLAASHDGRIRLLRNDSQRGVAFSLMRAIGSLDASIDFIARMDADDISQPDRLQLQLHFMQQQPNIHVLGTAVNVLSASSPSTTAATLPASSVSRQISNPTTAAMVEWSMSFYCSLAHPAVFMRRAIFHTHSYPVSPTLSSSSPCEDYALWLQLLRSSHRLANLPQPLLTLRRHSGCVSARRAAEQRREALRLATQHIRAVTRRRVSVRTVERMREPSSMRWREEASEVVGLLLAVEEAGRRRWANGGGAESDKEWQEVRTDATKRIGEVVMLAVQLGSRGTVQEEAVDQDREVDEVGMTAVVDENDDWRKFPRVPAVSSDSAALMSLWLARGGQSALLLSTLLLSGWK